MLPAAVSVLRWSKSFYPKIQLNCVSLIKIGPLAGLFCYDKALLGQLLETFVYQELRKHADWHEEALSFFHFRNKDKVEVDIIIEQGRKFAGIEIKAAATITQSDFFTKIINPLNVIGQFSDFNYDMMASYLNKTQSKEMAQVDDLWDEVMERSEKFEHVE